MTDAERIAALEEAVTRLEAAVGMAYATRAPQPSDIGPHNELPSGRYPLMLSDYQLRLQGITPMNEAIEVLGRDVLAINDLLVTHDDRLDAVEAKPAGSVDVQAGLAAYNIHIAPGKIAIGMPVDLDADPQLQIGGAGSAEIMLRSNMQGLDAQNPDEEHSSVVTGGNDGGIGFIQYGYWGRSGKKRNTLNRPMSALRLDSMGDLCKSTEPVGSTSDGGQDWYIRSAGDFIDFCTYKVNKTIRILKSAAGYGSTDERIL